MQLLPADGADFIRLPEDVRQEIEAWETMLRSVAPPIHQALQNIATRAGTSVQTARRRYDAFRKQGWRGLINRSKVASPQFDLSPEFIEWWKNLCQENNRKCKPAYRKFLEQYRKGAPIPGLSPLNRNLNPPTGCTYGNLIRHKPSPIELRAARIGRSSAADFRPKVFTTRAGLAVGQRYIFDDLWHDFKVVMLGQRRPMRLLQLHAHDLLSACQFARGLKPRIEDPDTGKSVGLKESEMLFLVAHVLDTFGHHPDGCVLMVEHGTAALSEAIEQILFDVTAGKVTVERSGIEAASAFAGQYAGRSKGNFRFKASLESLGNLIHNETADLVQFPGQTGSNSRINAPEELHGRERHADALNCALIAMLEKGQSGTDLRLPFLEATKAKWLVEAIMERINQRVDHDLEGWLEAGLTTIDFEVPGLGIIPSGNYLAMPPDKQASVAALGNPIARKLSPREVFDAGRRNLIKFRPEQTARLMIGSSSSSTVREVSVGSDHLIAFEDKDLSPSPLRFLAHHFAPGDKFQAVINPWSPHTLHLFNAKGGWIGVVDAWQRIPHTDTEALHAQMGRAASIEKQLLAPMAARGAAITRQRLADAQHNIEVLGQTTKQTSALESRSLEAFRKAASKPY
jgi:hypothetical protein